jgi:transposase
MTVSHYWLSEDQFARLVPLLPDDTRGVPRVDDRRVISGIVHVLRSGCRWKDAPAVYGPHKTLYNRFVRWAAKGVWEDVFHRLAETGGPPATLMLDATHVKVQRAAAGGKGGPPRRPSACHAADGPPSCTPPSTSTAGRGG